MLRVTAVTLLSALLASSPVLAEEPTSLPAGVLTTEVPSQRSDLGLGVGTYFASVGLQLGLHAAIFGSTALFIAYPSMVGGFLSDSDIATIITVAAVLAPPVMTFPSSHLTYLRASRSKELRPSWGKALLAGGVSSLTLIWSAALLATNGYRAQGHGSREWSVMWGPMLIMGIGSLVVPAAEILTLRYTAVQVTAAPVVLKGGGGLALALAF